MKPGLVSHLLIIYCVLALAAGQILFKALSGRSTSFAEIVADRTSLLMLVAALTIYGSSTLVWIVALRTVPLSYAYMFMAAGFVIVPLAARYFFQEPLSPRFLLGALVVAVGVWLTAGASR